MSELKPEHGTLQAYVTGFMLSLVFTFIPYYLVIEEVITGNKLLFTILSFGVLQMLVQILFFLHLGRRPRPWWQIIFFVMTVASILIVIGGSLIITHNLHYNMTPSDQVKKLTNDEGIAQVGGKPTGACEGQHANHQIIFQNNLATPSQTTAKQCDTLTFTNNTTATIELKFGTPTAKTTYGGEAGYTLRSGQNKTITLSEEGTFSFRDELKTSFNGSFTVVE